MRVLAPLDHDTRATALAHRGMRPQEREQPDWLIPLGPTLGWPSNGAVSNLSGSARAVVRLRSELRAGGFDVVHVHEPVTPLVAWDAMVSTGQPMVGHVPLLLREPRAARDRRRSSARAAGSTTSPSGSPSPRPRPGPASASTAASTGSCPTASSLPAGGVPAPRLREPGEPLRIAFVGQAVERKGLPVLLRAFEALREHVPVELTIVGASEPEVAPLLVDRTGVEILGRVSDDHKHEVLAAADVLAAPSLGGESFGMVLTEGFAAGTPVVASDIAGYRDVVADGVDGLLVPRGDATALAETLRDLALDPARTRVLGTARRVQRRALRVAEGRRAGRRDLRGRDRRPAAGGREGARRGPDGRQARRRRRAGPGAPAAVARARARGPDPAPPRASRAAPAWPSRPSRRWPAPTSRSSTSASTGSAARS